MPFVDRKTTPKLLPSPATAPSRTSSKQMGQRPQNSYKVEAPKLGHILEWHKESKTCLHYSLFFDILWLWLLLMHKPNQSKSAGNKLWHRHGIVRLQSSRSRIHGFPKYVSVWAMTPIDSMTLCWWNWWMLPRKMFQISCSRGHMHGETGPRKSGAALPYASLKEEPTR